MAIFAKIRHFEMNNDYFSTRKSCRNFKDKKIDYPEIQSIIEKASKAPTCGNMQLYSIIVTEEPDRLKKLASLHYNQPAALTAPVILTVCVDFNRFTKWCEINDARSVYKNLHSFIMGFTDAIIIAQQIVTIAELEGFGTCYLGTVTYNPAEISDFLNLPDLVFPVASIAIGYPEISGEETKRLPLEGIMYKEMYSIPKNEKIEEIYRVHDNDPGNKKFIDENKKENLAQVFSEVRYPGDLMRSLSESFLKLLQDKGFLHGSGIKI